MESIKSGLFIIKSVHRLMANSSFTLRWIFHPKAFVDGNALDKSSFKVFLLETKKCLSTGVIPD